MTPEPFGKYLLVERIAQGGMAEVFRAVHQGAAGVEKTVALKRVLPALGGASDFVAMFIDEARIAASLTHVNIAQVFEFGEVNGAYYLTMELVEGADLGRIAEAARKRRLPLPHAVVAFIVSEAARGLAFAHEKRGPKGALLGIVHRDVSPQNVLVSYAGEVKIADFGIAKAIGKLHKTESGAVMGKLRYMSPEQVTGEPLDGRSDLFSLGVVLHELLTGRTLFDGEHPGRVAEQVQHAEVKPPSAIEPGVPAELDRICLQALARARDSRYERASDLARDLSRFVSETAPGLTREDVGALIAELVPRASEPELSLKEAAATTVAIGGPPHRKTPVLPMTAVAPAPATPARSGEASGQLPPRAEARLWLYALAIVLVGAGGAVALRHRPQVVSPPIDAGHEVMDAATEAVDAAPTVALPSPPPIAPAERARLLAALSSVPQPDVARRGVPAEDYLALLSALDAALSTPPGPGGEPTIPAGALARLQPLRLEPEAQASARYLLATGSLPTPEAAALISFLEHHPAYSAAPPGWAFAALAVRVAPNEPRHLLDLMRENSALGRWRPRAENGAAPAGPFAPLYDRRWVVERYSALAPGPRAERLRGFLDAAPVSVPLDDGGLRFTVTGAARDDAAGKLEIDLDVKNLGAEARPLPALRLDGLAAAPSIEPATASVPGGADRALTLDFVGVTDELAEAARLVVRPGVALRAYSELLR